MDMTDLSGTLAFFTLPCPPPRPPKITRSFFEQDLADRICAAFHMLLCREARLVQLSHYDLETVTSSAVFYLPSPSEHTTRPLHVTSLHEQSGVMTVHLASPELLSSVPLTA